MIDRGLFDKWWRDPGVNSLAVYLAPGTDAQKVAEEFRRRFSTQGEFLIYPNRVLRQRILTIFDQTFAVTYVLRAIAVIVAIVGIFLSLTALVIERERDIGILRSLGASQAQVRKLFLTEAALIGFIASALGIAAGICLAMVLTWVVNKAFFGWTIALQFPVALLVATPLWIIAAAVAAAWLPAAQASRVPIAAAVRAE
jgi:putative ABC transport system permease protein